MITLLRPPAPAVASNRRRPGACRASSVDVAVPAITASDANSAMSANVSSGDISVLEFDHLPNDQRARDLHEDGCVDQIHPERRTGQGPQMIGVEQEQEEGESRGYAHQHHAGHAGVCRDDANLTLDAEPIANDGRDVVENFREVAARLVL